MKKMTEKELLLARKKRAQKFPSPAWGDHVIRGVRRLTRAVRQDSAPANWAPTFVVKEAQ